MKVTRAGNFVFTPDELEFHNRQHHAQGYQRAKTELAPVEAKLDNIKATTALLEQAGKVMSRAGYLIGKVNHDNSR